MFPAGDVRHEGCHDAAVALCSERFGGLDADVDDAGAPARGPLHATSPEAWEEVNAVNMRGTFPGCRAAIRHMRASGGGAIVNIGSILSSTAAPLLCSCTATKHGVPSLARAIAVDEAASVPFLASVDASCVTAAELLVDGGLVAKAYSGARRRERGNRAGLHALLR